MMKCCDRGFSRADEPHRIYLPVSFVRHLAADSVTTHGAGSRNDKKRVTKLGKMKVVIVNVVLWNFVQR